MEQCRRKDILNAVTALFSLFPWLQWHKVRLQLHYYANELFTKENRQFLVKWYFDFPKYLTSQFLMTFYLLSALHRLVSGNTKKKNQRRRKRYISNLTIYYISTGIPEQNLSFENTAININIWERKLINMEDTIQGFRKINLRRDAISTTHGQKKSRIKWRDMSGRKTVNG